MSATAESDDTLVRQLPTDDLRAPQHDVRQTRSDEDIRTISESMERSGQLHAAYVVPIVPTDVEDEDEWRNQPVETLDSECTSYRLVDGMTRWLAAQELNWATLRCEVHSEPPENQTVTSLEANTSRVDMSDYETTRALYDHYQRTGHTQAEIAETAGISRSRLGNLFRALDGFNQAVKAWRDPDTHVSSGHVLQIERLETSAHKARAFRDLMHNQRSVSMLSEVVDNVADMERWAAKKSNDGTVSSKNVRFELQPRSSSCGGGVAALASPAHRKRKPRERRNTASQASRRRPACITSVP